jgi:hypothetical protein
VPWDFTASDAFRKRPRFAASESEPIMSRVSERLSTSTRPSLAPSHRATDKRRVSNPLPSTSRSDVQSDSNAVLVQVPRQRAASAQSGRLAPDSPLSSTTSQPIQLPVSDSSRLIDIKLRKKLQEPVKSDTCGVIYILRDKARQDRGYKIGWTTRLDYSARIDEHRRTCKFEPLVVHKVYDVYCGHRTEQLIHGDLMDRRRNWSCMGHKKGGGISVHGEWFDITEDVARKTVDKWAAFMNNHRPYNWRGNLCSLWIHLLRNRKLTNQDSLDHNTRREQWRYIHSTINWLCCTWHTLLSILLRFWPYFWQVLSLTYSFVTLLLCRNTVTSSAFALVSMCACLSIVLQSNLPLKRQGRVYQARS